MKASVKIIFFFLTFGFESAIGQISSFTTSSTLCSNEVSTLNNTSSGAASYLWDFCQDGFKNPSNVSVAITISSANISEGVEIANDNGNWYGFMFSRNDNKLFRLDFGSSLNNTPSTVDLGNIGGLLSLPTCLKVVNENGMWYAFITNYQNSHLIRIKFGAVLNAPSAAIIATDLGNYAGGTGPRGLDCVKSGSDVIVSISYWNDDVLTLVKFSNTVEDNPSLVSAFKITSVSSSFPGSHGPMGIGLQQVNGNWFGLVSSNKSGKVFHLSFGSNLFSQPTVNLLTSLNVPSDLIIKKDGLNYYAFVEQLSSLVRIDLANDFHYTGSEIVTNFGSFGGMLTDNYGLLGLSIVRDGANWHAFVMKQFLNQIVKIDFNDVCGISSGLNFNSLTTPSPTANFFNKPGNYAVELIAYSSTGGFDISSSIINVSTTLAPSIDFTTDNICVNNTTTFLVNSSSTINQWDWDFGDGQIAAGANPTHLYNGIGSYNVELNIVAANSCSNQLMKTIQIFNPPVANFSLPVNNPLCTNQQVTFVNNSVSDAGSSPDYKWLVNGSLVSSSKDLQYLFNNTASQVIKLQASLPGCMNEKTQIINSLLAGPDVSFTANNGCVQDAIAFTNATTDPIIGYTWDFGDLQTSNSSNTITNHSYTAQGGYVVSLTGSSANGCNNSAIKNVTIYSKPIPNFSLSLPPFSCSGSESQFNDLTPAPTDSNLNTWLWNFNDPNSSLNTSGQKNAKHTYDVAGDYNVSLTVGTDFGCTNSIQKKVTITQSPVADFTSTPYCKDKAVDFKGLDKGDIQSWYWQIESGFYFISNPTHVFSIAGNNSVNLTVTGNNNCIAFLSRNIVVQAPLNPDFAVLKNCTNQSTQFTDLTVATTDPMRLQEWDFSGLGKNTGSPTTFSFPAIGGFDVSLKVTAQSGCAYSVTKKINIIDSPVASFTASPELGVPPFTVQFNNTSRNATHYEWIFHDEKDSLTNAVSPQYTFKNYSDYVVDLTATNTIGCSSIFSKIIKGLLPLNNVAITALNITENTDGTYKLIATLKNLSNYSITHVDIDVDLSGTASIRESVDGAIAPDALFNHVFGYEIVNKQKLNYLCADVVLARDIDESNNLICTNFGDQLYLYEPYPNPTAQQLHIDWIAIDDQPLQVILLDALGKEVIREELSSSTGLNQRGLDLSETNKGIYVLILKTATVRKTYKIAVSQ